MVLSSNLGYMDIPWLQRHHLGFVHCGSTFQMPMHCGTNFIVCIVLTMCESCPSQSSYWKRKVLNRAWLHNTISFHSPLKGTQRAAVSLPIQAESGTLQIPSSSAALLWLCLLLLQLLKLDDLIPTYRWWRLKQLQYTTTVWLLDLLIMREQLSGAAAWVSQVQSYTVYLSTSSQKWLLLEPLIYR